MKVLICTFGNVFHYSCRLFYSLLKDKVQAELYFFNCHWDGKVEESVKEYMRTVKPDLVAVSLLTFEFGLCKELVKAIRDVRSPDETKVIFGGPHAFLAPEDCLKSADFVCTGEGEFTMLGLCEQFNIAKGWDRAALGAVPNLAYFKDNAMHYSDLQDFYYSRKAIDELPFPAYGEPGIFIYDGKTWRHDEAVNNDFYYVFSSRGCPYSCSYCINSMYKQRKVTLRSPRKLIEELVIVKEKFPNLNRISFVDEVFCWSQKWVVEFARLYKESVNLPFDCDSFPGRHSEEVIRILAGCGLKRVNVGVQSCSERILSEIFMRPQKVKDVIKDNMIYIANGVIPSYDFIVDNPFETEEDLLETVEVVRQLKRPNFFRVFGLYFFPYHSLTKRAEREGLLDGRGDEQPFYHKITTTHKGDQYCKKPWYTHPLKTMRDGDKKAVLNWLIVCYGDQAIPKRLVDAAFDEYKKGKWRLILFLSCCYRFLDKVYQKKERSRITFILRMYRQKGYIKTSRYLLRKISLRGKNLLRPKYEMENN